MPPTPTPNRDHWYRATIVWTNGDKHSHVSPTLQQAATWMVSAWLDSKSPVRWATITPVPSATPTAPKTP